MMRYIGIEQSLIWSFLGLLVERDYRRASRWFVPGEWKKYEIEVVVENPSMDSRHIGTLVRQPHSAAA